jgi:hypothetical protein
MDELIKTIILGAPNLAVALYVLYRQQKTIDALLEAQTKLIDRLLSYVDRDKQNAQEVILTQRAAPPLP